MAGTPRRGKAAPGSALRGPKNGGAIGGLLYESSGVGRDTHLGLGAVERAAHRWCGIGRTVRDPGLGPGHDVRRQSGEEHLKPNARQRLPH